MKKRDQQHVQEIHSVLTAAAAAGAGTMTARDVTEAVELVARGEVERAAVALLAVGTSLGSDRLESLLVKGGIPPLYAHGAATTLKLVAVLANIAAGNSGALEALLGEALDAVSRPAREEHGSDDVQ